MTMTKNASLVLNAEKHRQAVLSKALATAQESYAQDGASVYVKAMGPWERELHFVNLHITVSPEEIDAAKNAYTEVGHHLVRKLNWPNEAINVHPQGSAINQTLIRSPDNSKFDIDAVCQVDISRVDALNPVGFFNHVGEALVELSATAKKRCWNIPFKGESFYLEFTPSVPLENVPSHVLAHMNAHYSPAHEYISTALAVVDNPTKKWKTSNPAGFAKWVDDTAKLQLVVSKFSLEESSLFKAAANVAPVPDQDVEITDTLRVAIRLFKRHRDMCTRRELIDKNYKPISVIIVTLLTDCYAGLSDLGRTYSNPVQLLADLANLLPSMVYMENGKYKVDNPTVSGENFAERWNDAKDGSDRQKAFFTWCDILASDMTLILSAQGEKDIRERVREVFGCPPDKSSPNGSGGSGGNAPVRQLTPSPPAPRTLGLA